MSKCVPGHFKMPFGMYKGKMYEDIPAGYLLYLHDSGKLFGQVLSYVEENLETLRMQAANDKKGIR